MVEIALVDLFSRHEALDIDGMRAVDLDRLQFSFFDLDIFVFGEFIAAGLVAALDDITRLHVHHLLPEPVAGLLVNEMEAGFLGAGGGRDKAEQDRRLVKASVTLSNKPVQPLHSLRPVGE